MLISHTMPRIAKEKLSVTNMAVLHHIHCEIVLRMKVNVMHVDGTLLCMRKVHYGHVCRAPKSVHEVEGEKEDAIFIGSITTDGEPWTVNTGIHDSSVTFKIDRGADVTSCHTLGSWRYTRTIHQYSENQHSHSWDQVGVHLMLWASPGCC